MFQKAVRIVVRAATVASAVAAVALIVGFVMVLT